SRGRDRGVDDDCDGEYTRRFLTRLRRPETILRPGRWTGLAMFAMTMGRFAITSKAPCATASCPIFRASRSPGQTAKQLSGANPPGGYSATHIAGAALPTGQTSPFVGRLDLQQVAQHRDQWLVGRRHRIVGEPRRPHPGEALAFLRRRAPRPFTAEIERH